MNEEQIFYRGDVGGGADIRIGQVKECLALVRNTCLTKALFLYTILSYLTNKKAFNMNNKSPKIKTEQEIAKMRKQGARTLAGVMSIATLVTPVAGSLALSGCENETSNPGKPADYDEEYGYNLNNYMNSFDIRIYSLIPNIQNDMAGSETLIYRIADAWNDVVNNDVMGTGYDVKINRFKSFKIVVDSVSDSGAYCLDTDKNLTIFLDETKINRTDTYLYTTNAISQMIDAGVADSKMVAAIKGINIQKSILPKLASAKGIATPRQLAAQQNVRKSQLAREEKGA